MNGMDSQTGNRRMLWLTALAFAWGVSVSQVAAAQIYGWTDANGQVTYSNLPPPKNVKITDVIPDTPVSPAVVQEAARRSEISALNDRIRLLEFEQARTKREVVDYPAAPLAPLVSGAAACGPDGYSDCNSQWGPYYTTGFLYGSGGRHHHDDHDGRGAGNTNGNARLDHPPRKPAAPPSPRLAPIAASPNKSSLQ